MDYLAMAKEAYDSSTTYLDGNLRADLDYSLKAFRLEHANGSRYLSDEYKHRSRIVSPKTRSVIRKNEAAAMQAMFANKEFVHTDPGNPDDAMSVANAECVKELLDYRLTRSIPAFQIYLGGVQDAQTSGVVCSYQYWEYEQREGKKIKDKPCIELRPIENIRLDAGASWLDPVGSSPYFCDIVPMYVVDVKNMMETDDPKTGAPKWKKYADDIILKARPDVMDSTRSARLGKMQDPFDETPDIKGFDVVWVMRWFMREGGGDKVFYTLGTEEMLTEPKDIEEVYFHGKRPYVMGYAILESHKTFKTSMPMLLKPLQTESTDLRNQRMDNVRFVLNPRWLVARGRQTDVQSLVRNVPGGVTLTSDPNLDIKESRWADVTSSSYVEHDRLNAETDDLAGNFSPSTKVANNAVNDTLGGSRMASAGAGMMSQYLIDTINETWWQPVLNQLTLLEQYYETDEIILGVCASKAKLFQKFGISRITDMMLMNEVIVSVDASHGDPQQKFQKFMAATGAAMQLSAQAPPGFNVPEAIKEIYSTAGYRNGERFFDGKQDPRLIKAAQTIQQLQGLLKGKQMEIQAGQQTEAAKIQSNEKIKAAQLQVDNVRIQGDLQIKQAQLVIEQQQLELEKAKLQLEAAIASNDAALKDKEIPFKIAELQASVGEAQSKLEGERMKLVGLAHKIAHETEQAKLDLAASETAQNNEGKIADTTNKVNESVQKMMAEIDGIRTGMSGALTGLDGKIANLHAGMTGMAGVLSTPKRNPKGFRMLKGPDKRTRAVAVDYHDGSTEEIPVQ